MDARDKIFNNLRSLSLRKLIKNLSGGWDLNPRRPPWQGGILATELPPRLQQLKMFFRKIAASPNDHILLSKIVGAAADSREIFLIEPRNLRYAHVAG